MEVDAALALLPRTNPWQLRSYCVFGSAFGIAFAWMRLAIVFVGDAPYYHCQVPENATLDEWLPLGDKGKYKQCEQYSNYSVKNETTGCQHGYWYDPSSGYDETIATEWSLVCGDAWLVELVMMLINAGSGLGALVFTRLADGLGRRPVFLLCIGVNILSILLRALAPNFAAFVTVALIDGIFQTGLSTTSFVLALELFPTSRRSFAGVAIELFWALGYVSVTLLAYLLRHWRHLLITLAALLSPMISFYWLAPESIPWLVANGREEEAEGLLRAALEGSGLQAPAYIFSRAGSPPDSPGRNTGPDAEKSTLAESGGDRSEINGVPVHTNRGRDGHRYSDAKASEDGQENRITGHGTNQTRTGKNVDGEGCLGYARQVGRILRDTFTCKDRARRQGDNQYSPREILRHPTLRKYAVVMFITWFVNGLTYYAMAFSVSYVPGDRYVNNAFYGLLEAPAYLLAWLLVFRVGRRLPLCVCHVIAGLALLGSLLQSYDFGVDLTVLHIILNQIGKFGITITFAIIIAYTPELYPTNLRSTGFGFSMASSKTAQLLSPYARTLHRENPLVVPAVMGTVSVLVGLLVLVLPETRYNHLPDTLEDVERLGRGPGGTKGNEEAVI